MDKKVSIIEPLSREEKIKTAAYARVSSKSDDQIHSFNSQVAYYSQYINQLQNTIIVDVYTDEGITGTVIEKRNGFKKMIQDCRDGLIDRIITKSIARFGRNFTETLKTLRELKCLGVSIYFEEEHIDTADSVSETSISTYMMSAELESRTISYNQRWGFRTRAEKGIYNQPHLPYGYYRIDGKILINESEAVIVRLLFDMYVNQDMSTVAITNYFSQNKIGGRTWSRSGIVLMLINERYCGDKLLQKKFTTDEFPFHLVMNKGELPQYYVYDSFPKIIERSLYEASYAKWERNRENLSDNQLSANKRYPYTSKIECAECHEKFKRRTYRGVEFWCCKKHLVDHDSCMNKQISKEELDEAFLKLYYKLKNSIDILESYGRNIVKLLMDDEKEKELMMLDKELHNLKAEKLRLLKENLEGKISDIEKISNLNEIQMYKSLYELEKKKVLNQVYESAEYRNNQRLVDVLRHSASIDTFDEVIFHEIVQKVMIGQNHIYFQLHNDLMIKSERKKYDGHYS